MDRLEQLKANYFIDGKYTLETKELFELIELLSKENDSLYKTIQEISDKQEREIDKNDYRDDLY